MATCSESGAIHCMYYTYPLATGFFDQNEINKIMEESVKMKHFKHPNVMSLIGVCTDAGPAPYIVMPFMANGSLLSYLRKERQNILLKETADDDLVRAYNGLYLSPCHAPNDTKFLGLTRPGHCFMNPLNVHPENNRVYGHGVLETHG